MSSSSFQNDIFYCGKKKEIEMVEEEEEESNTIIHIFSRIEEMRKECLLSELELIGIYSTNWTVNLFHQRKGLFGGFLEKIRTCFDRFWSFNVVI